MTEPFTFTFHFHALEKEMATHSSVLSWRIPRMGEPGGLPSVGLHRVGHDWSDLAAAAAGNIGKPHLLLFLLALVEKGQVAPNQNYPTHFWNCSLELPSETMTTFTKYPVSRDLAFGFRIKSFCASSIKENGHSCCGKHCFLFKNWDMVKIHEMVSYVALSSKSNFKRIGRIFFIVTVLLE